MAIAPERKASVLCVLSLVVLSACHRSGGDSTEDPGPGGPGDGPGAPIPATVANGDAGAAEGDSGTSSFQFSVALSRPLAQAVQVHYETRNGSAVAGGPDADFEPASGTILFEPGALAHTVEVFVHGDGQVEQDEVFRVLLTDIEGGGATLGRATGIGSVLNDDYHRLSAIDRAQPEGDFEPGNFEFRVELWPPSSEEVSVWFTSHGLEATYGFDHLADGRARKGELVFEPGVVTRFARFAMQGDLLPGVDETFELELHTPQGENVVIERDRAVGTILDDDEPEWLDADLGVGGAFDPDVARSGELVAALWLSEREGGSKLYLERSADGGRTWAEPAQRIDRAPDGVPVVGARICAGGSSVYAVWHDARDGRSDIRFNRSHDGGLSWLADDLRIDTDAPGQSDSVEPRIACSGGNVYVVWQDFRGGTPHVRFNRSSDGGATWQANDLRLDDGGAAARAPELAASGQSVYVVWSDQRNGTADVYFDASHDAGVNWRPVDRRIDRDVGDGRSHSARVAAHGANVFVVWLDERDGLPNVYFDRSLDGGDGWDVAEQRLNVGEAGSYTARNVRVACHEYSVIVAWEDDRNGLEDVYVSSSQSAGFMWRSNIRVSRGGPPGASRSTDPELAYNGRSALVVWRDSRAGATNLYLNRSLDSGRTFLGDAVRIGSGVAGAFPVRTHRIAMYGEHTSIVWRESRASEDVLLRSVRIQ